MRPCRSPRERLARRGRRASGRPDRRRCRPRACRSSAAAARSSAGAGSARSRPTRWLCAARVSIGGVPVDVVGGVGRRAAARAHAPPRRAGADGARARAQPPGSTCASRRARASRSSRRTARSTSGPASRAASPMRGTVLGRPFEGCGFVDDTAGYHARRHGVALVGRRRRGRVGRARGVEPGRRRARRAEPSERTVWVDGTPAPRRAAAVRRRPLARSATCAARPSRCARTASACSCSPPSTRCRSGASAARCPHAGPLREGWGVMERHEVRW